MERHQKKQPNIKKEKMSKNVAKQILDLLQFLNGAPTAWHAVDIVKQRLMKHNFTVLKEEDPWNLEPGKSYLVIRNGSSLCAFITPKNSLKAFRIIGSHTDSPSFKLKPNAEFRKENMIMIGVEIYGGPLLTSWLNRDLGIAGRIVFKDAKGKIQESLVNLKNHPVLIPQLAIHLDRTVNESGLILNKQEHLAALAALEDSKSSKKDKGKYLEKLLKEAVEYKTLLSHDLFLYPLEPARLIGLHNEMISSYRIDSLNSVHAGMQAIEKAKPSKDTLKMAIFWDNEEIGSDTAQGAGSPFLEHLLERINLALGQNREDFLRLFQASLCISVDLVHALHPNYGDRLEPRHLSLLNGGIVIKNSAQQRYATDARSAAIVVEACHKHKIPFQRFVSRGDIPAGTTIGPIAAHLLGMPTVDIGCSQLSMHSCRELTASEDHLHMCRLLTALLQVP